MDLKSRPLPDSRLALAVTITAGLPLDVHNNIHAYLQYL